MSGPTMDSLLEIITNLQARVERSERNQPAHLTSRTGDSHNDDPIAKKFIEDPVTIHNTMNPRKTVLVFDGSNYSQWESAINHTLRRALRPDSSFMNDPNAFNHLSRDYCKSITILLRNTIDNTLLSVVEGSGTEDAKSLIDLLRKKCSKTDRRHKLAIIDRFLTAVNNKSGSDDLWIAGWHKIIADLNRVDVTLDEFYGLVVQASATPPPGIDAQNFK